MAHLEILTADSRETLGTLAGPWDTLWRATPDANPSARAAALAQWLAYFQPDDRCRLCLVVAEGVPVLGLPLVERRGRWGLATADLPTNAWTTGGRLLFDPTGPLDRAATRLVSELDRGPWSRLTLESVEPEQPGWQALGAAWDRAGWLRHAEERFSIGLVDTAGSWDDYWASRSRNHRRDLKRKESRLTQAGLVEFHRPRVTSPDELVPRLQTVFEVEDRGWKGRATTSVLRHREAWDYYVLWAGLLAGAGELDLSWLTLDGRAIATQFGWRTGGCYWCLKIGYDEAFAEFSPGQLLMARVVADCFADSECRLVNFTGPLIDATARWATGGYSLARWQIARPSPLGRAWIGWRRLRQLVRDRRRLGHSAAPSVTPCPQQPTSEQSPAGL